MQRTRRRPHRTTLTPGSMTARLQTGRPRSWKRPATPPVKLRISLGGKELRGAPRSLGRINEKGSCLQRPSQPTQHATFYRADGFVACSMTSLERTMECPLEAGNGLIKIVHQITADPIGAVAEPPP